jgi:RimJ/RimL family protein N-acetyltransferase
MTADASAREAAPGEPREPARLELRAIEPADFEAAARFPYTLSIAEPLTEIALIERDYARSGLWTRDAGARAIVDPADGRLVGTTQFYQSGLCIHGYEIGYVIHDERDYGRGYATQALALMRDLLWRERPDCYRLQLIIETWNGASCTVAERCGFELEGTLRMAGYSSVPPQDCFLYSAVRVSPASGVASPGGAAGSSIKS